MARFEQVLDFIVMDVILLNTLLQGCLRECDVQELGGHEGHHLAHLHLLAFTCKCHDSVVAQFCAARC